MSRCNIYNEFRYLRDFFVIILVRQSITTVPKILCWTGSVDLIRDYLPDDLVTRYDSLRSMLQCGDRMFPTDDGCLYRPKKFYQNVERLLARAQVPTRPVHPAKMTDKQFNAIAGMRFHYQRHHHQKILAVALLGLGGLRPEEIATLRRSDINISDGTILLVDTKSQTDQLMPIHPDMIAPLAKFLQHLDEDDAYLFVRSTGQPWDRKDVRKSALEFGSELGIQNTTPRRWRSTVAHMLMYSGVPTNVVGLYMRHADEATTVRHYTSVRNINAIRKAMNRFTLNLNYKKKGDVFDF